jgi:hypothetical protein
LETTNNNDNTNPPAISGQWPQARQTAVPTALFPTPIPSSTPVPDPLRVGGSLAYTLRENGQEDLWTISVGESGPLRLTNSPADERDPAWSPDGTRLAFASNRDGNWELYYMQIDTGAITRLTYTPGFEGAPTWSPDGAYIAYEGYNDDTQDLDIYIISSDPARAASEGALRATFTVGPDIEPAWGPGGRTIAFSSWRTGDQDIYILSLDASGGDSLALNLTNTPDINEDYPPINLPPRPSWLDGAKCRSGHPTTAVSCIRSTSARPALGGARRFWRALSAVSARRRTLSPCPISPRIPIGPAQPCLLTSSPAAGSAPARKLPVRSTPKLNASKPPGCTVWPR